MEKQGYDTYIFPAAGYSTLGWFDDPLPSGLLFYDDVTLVDVVIHELLHQNVYVGSQIEFNETLASAVSKRLTPGFFHERGEALEAAAAENAQRLWLAQSDVFDEFADRLTRYFEASKDVDRAEMLAGRAAIYRELEERLRALQPPGSPDVETGPISNNAVFLALWRYRKQASLVDRYLASFPDVRAAVADLRERAEQEGDPYALLAARLDATACCSGKITVSFLGSVSRRAADTIEQSRGAGPGERS
jgi:predicted aminopeptidase